jgi:deoxycytidylate deaminase
MKIKVITAVPAQILTKSIIEALLREIVYIDKFNFPPINT